MAKVNIKAEAVAAAKGAALLDKVNPGWFTTLDLTELYMQRSNQCILGHCYGDFYRGLAALRPRLRRGGESQCHFSRDYGFNAQLDSKGDAIGGSYERLGLAWAAEIGKRRLTAEMQQVLVNRRVL